MTCTRFTTHRVLLALLGIVWISSSSPAVAGSSATDTGREVHTDISRVHACLPLSDRAGESGFLAATDGGLAHIANDGQIRAVWTALDGLPGTQVRAITGPIADDGDTLWIGTENGLAQVRVRGARLEILATRRSKPVHALLRHGDVLYVGTWGDGVKQMKRRAGKWGPLVAVRFAGQASQARDRISDLVVHDGAIVAATAGRGLFALRGDRMRALSGVPGDAMVWSLASRDGTLWVGTVDGLHAVRDGASQRISDGDIRHIDASAQGAVRVATFGNGVRLVRASRLTGARDVPADAHFVNGFAAASTVAPTVESGDLACIATHHGLWVKSPRGRWVEAGVNGPPSGDISAMAVSGDQLWVGTFDHGLAVYHDGRWRHVEDPRIDHHINALAVSDGRLWVATSAGLSVLPLPARAAGSGGGSTSRDRNSPTGATRLDQRDGLPSRHILSLAPLRDGGVVVGTTRGAVTIRDDQLIVLGTKQGLAVKNVWAVAEDRDGWLWLGTTRGLYRGRSDADWQRYSVASGHLRDDWVMALSIAHGSVWVGTYKGGVTRLTRESGMRGDEQTARNQAEAGEFRATVVGDGWINPGGLAWHGDTLYAATMEGLFIGDETGWRQHRGHGKNLAAPGRDTTGVIAQPAPGGPGSAARLWIASRRGLAALAP